MELEQYKNIDRIVRKQKSNKVKSNKLNSIKHLYYIKEQFYWNEKIYFNKTAKDVLNELKENNVEEITRMLFYDNCCFLQYKRRF